MNQEDLQREMAQGHGDKLATLAALNGCSDDLTVAAFGAKAQSSYEVIVPSAKVSAVDVVQNMKSVQLADACKGS